jgi:Ca-activated chloride channel family protein
MMNGFRRLLLSAVALMLAMGETWAADETGAIAGNVFDQNGAPLRGVAIGATGGPEKLARKATTDAAGAFSISNLPPGLYDVKASAPRMQSHAERNVRVISGRTTTLTLVLEIEGGVEEVRVVERAPQVSTTTSNAREVYDLEFAPRSSGAAGTPRIDQYLGASWRYNANGNTERYAHHTDNPFLGSRENPLSTFSIDVDTASYANLRRFLRDRSRPPVDAVRIEEMINYFPYEYPAPPGDEPMAVSFEVNDCPWDDEARLVQLRVRGKEIAAPQRPASNLVFLVDVSGSMAEPAKLPLVRQSLRLLLDTLGPRDRVALVVYAGHSGVVLPSTPATQRPLILEAIERLEAGGSTNGGQGIELAYDIAVRNFIHGGNNRVLLATDGDFNVGVTSPGELVRLIEDKARSGVFLTTLGFGTGNLQDATMEQLADHGNGNYAYIDSIEEARKVLTEQVSSTLLTVAKDVKLQVEFNPARVAVYRLIGYENRLLRKEDFNDDRKDAGELGAGETVTALYEIIPAHRSAHADGGSVDPLRYQRAGDLTGSGDLLTVKARYKMPDGWFSKKREWTVTDSGSHLTQASNDFRFAAAVAAFGMILRDSPHKGTANHDLVLNLASGALGGDRNGYRRGFLELVRQSRALEPEPAAALSHHGVGW